jgi:hypothetical protein
MTEPASLHGVERLRSQRGAERVTFDDVADHLVDYIDRHPETRDTVDQLAAFLARVERIDHDHAAVPDRGLTPPDE